MKKSKKIAVFLGVFLALAAVFYFALQPKTNSALKTNTTTKTAISKATKQKKKITLTAVGDSLTYGVGDTTNKGGYVALIKQKLVKQNKLQVTTYNYGKTGDRSEQIEKRVLESKTIQKNLKNADVITLTVGGNDLMQVLQKNFLYLVNNTLSSTMPSAEKSYAKKLTSLLKTIRKYNKDAPIFMFSVYNPFYVYFPTLTQIQQYTDEWNKVSKKVIASDSKIYFVDINKQLSEGQYYGKSKSSLKNSTTTDLNNVSDGKLETMLSDTEEKNDYLSSEDHFHPNNKGYRYMTSQLYKVMMAHKKTWLEEN